MSWLIKNTLVWITGLNILPPILPLSSLWEFPYGVHPLVLVFLSASILRMAWSLFLLIEMSLKMSAVFLSARAPGEKGKRGLTRW